jgi:asparagine synthase (glutamine-hydrolysing)
LGNFLVVLPADDRQAEAEHVFRSGLELARVLKGQQPGQVLETEWARVASFPRRNGSAAPLVTDPASGCWLLASGTYFHADGGGIGAEAQLLRKYLSAGPERLAGDMEGFFVLLVADPRSREVVVITDLVGSCHCFAREWEGGVALSGSSLLLAGLAECRPDPVACQEFLRTGVIYEQRTIHREVRKLGPAAVYRFRGGTRTAEQRYWRITDVTPESLDGPAAVSALGEALAEVARKVATAFPRPVCDLTGGYDSRAVVAMFRTAGVPFATVVAGPPDSRDVTVAGALARLADLPHLHVPPEPPSLPRIKDALRLTDGEFDLVKYARILAIHERLAETCDISLNGSLGEVARGYWWELLFPRAGRRLPLDAATVARRRFAALPSDPSLFPPGQRLDLAAHFADVIGRTNAGLSGLPNTLQVDNVYLMLRMQRWQGRIASSTNQLWPCLQPFLCRSVLEAVLRAATQLRRRGLLIRQLLARYQPELAAWPLEQGYPALPFTWRTAYRFAPLLRSWAAKALGKLRSRLRGTGAAGAAPGSLPQRLQLWADEEVRELLNPATMRLGRLLDPPAVADFLRRSREPGFGFDGQWARLLSLEYALRVLEGARQQAPQPAACAS